MAAENRSFRGRGGSLTVESQQSIAKPQKMVKTCTILHSQFFLDKISERQQKSGFKKKSLSMF